MSINSTIQDVHDKLKYDNDDVTFHMGLYPGKETMLTDGGTNEKSFEKIGKWRKIFIQTLGNRFGQIIETKWNFKVSKTNIPNNLHKRDNA